MLSDNELRQLKARPIYDEREKYDIVYRSKDGYEFLGLLWLPYGDEYYYRNLKTDEIVCIYYSIGD